MSSVSIFSRILVNILTLWLIWFVLTTSEVISVYQISISLGRKPPVASAVKAPTVNYTVCSNDKPSLQAPQLLSVNQ